MFDKTPRKILSGFVLDALKHYGGAASTPQIRDWLCENHPELTPEDMYQFRWCQQNLKKDGLVVSPTKSASKLWELTNV